MTRALVFLALLACESPAVVSEKASASTVKSGSASTPALCDKADRLQKRLAGLDTKAARLGVDPGFVLPESTTGESMSTDAVIVTIGPKQIRVNDEPLAGAADVTERVASHGTVLLAIPRGNEGIDRLRDVIAAIGPRHQIYLIATPPGAKAEPAPKGLDLGKSASERASVLAQAVKRSIGSCAEANKLFARLSSPSGENKAETVKKDLPAAIDACRCNVTDELEEVVAYLIAGNLPVVGKKLNVSSDKGAKAISLTSLDGQKLYDALPADGALVRLET